MDMITYAMAKAYSDKKGGYVEPAKQLGHIELTKNGSFIGDLGFDIETGKTYTVTTESGTFMATVKETEGSFYLGNLGLAEFVEGSGESFFVSPDINGEDEGVAIDANGGSYIKVSTPETIVPIDPKFLPGVCLPVVEITEIAEITDAEAATIDAVAEMKCPICLNTFVSAYGYTVSIPMIYAHNGTYPSYVAETPFGEVSLAKIDGVWVSNIA